MKSVLLKRIVQIWLYGFLTLIYQLVSSVHLSESISKRGIDEIFKRKNILRNVFLILHNFCICLISSWWGLLDSEFLCTCPPVQPTDVVLHQPTVDVINESPGGFYLSSKVPDVIREVVVWKGLLKTSRGCDRDCLETWEGYIRCWFSYTVLWGRVCFLYFYYTWNDSDYQTKF